MYTKKISNFVFDKSDVRDARHAFLQYLDVQIKPCELNCVELSFRVHSEYESQSREVILEFFNYLIDTSAQRKMRG